MKATAIATSLALILAGITAVPLLGVAQPVSSFEVGDGVLQMSNDADAANATNETPPGARLAGVVGAQEAEVRGEVESRTFGVALDRAGSDEARARVVARQAGDLQDRLEDLRDRKQELRREHRNGNITTATYVAELTALTARTESVRGLANQSHTAARELPPEVAERNGVNVSAIRLLQQDAANMTGPEVARIARSIAGPKVGKPVAVGVAARAAGNGSVGPPGEGVRGPPDDDAANRSERGGPGGMPTDDDGNTTGDVVETVTGAVENTTDELANETDDTETTSTPVGNAIDSTDNFSERAASAVDRAEARVADGAVRIEEAEVGANVTALADAEAALADARDDLEAARSALDEGDAERAHSLAERAIEHVERVEGLLDDATGS